MFQPINNARNMEERRSSEDSGGSRQRDIEHHGARWRIGSHWLKPKIESFAGVADGFLLCISHTGTVGNLPEWEEPQRRPFSGRRLACRFLRPAGIIECELRPFSHKHAMEFRRARRDAQPGGRDAPPGKLAPRCPARRARCRALPSVNFQARRRRALRNYR